MTRPIKLLVALCSIGMWHIGVNPTAALADITNWQTGETIPGTEGISPGPGTDLSYWNTDSRNLRYADFSGGLDLQGSTFATTWLDFALLAQANLANANFWNSTLTGADLSLANLTDSDFTFATLTAASLSQANLTGASFFGSSLTSTGLTDAVVVGASFWSTTSRSFTQEQLYSTASYKNRNLAGIALGGNDLTGWNFAGQNLTGAYFSNSTLTGANLTDAIVVSASFKNTKSGGFTEEQLYSTASYQIRNLAEIDLGENDLTGWDFAGQNLTNANFYGSTLIAASLSQANLSGASFFGSSLAGTDLTDAVVVGASFERTTSRGFTQEQLYSTASYKNRNLAGIALGGNDLTGWNFAGQNLTKSVFTTVECPELWCFYFPSALSNVNLTDANVEGANFAATTSGGFTEEQLYSTASYKNRDLAGIDLSANDLTGWNFAGQNLAGASFGSNWRVSTLTNADLTDAIVVGASFRNTTSGGFTEEQLYSTASYKNRDLAGIDLSANDLTGWNFAGQNLTGAKFLSWPAPCTLTNADLSQANLTDASFWCAALTGADTRGATGSQFAGATLTNTILANGHVVGLELGAGQTLVIRDYDGNPDPWDGNPPIPIHVEQKFGMGAGGTLKMLFDADAWDSTISFDAGIPVTLGGTLGLDFAPGVDLASQLGRTFEVFDWTGVTPSGQFAIASPYLWDVSSLYTAGQVTFVGVAEPTGWWLALMALAAGTLATRRRFSDAVYTCGTAITPCEKGELL